MLKVQKKKELLKAAALRQGDRVALLSPSSRPATPAVVASAQRLMTEMGFVPELGKHAMSTHGFMAGTDAERLADLHLAFADDGIKAIFCLTGGYGAMHLLPKIDYKLVTDNPKIIVGCEDNTVLLNAIFEQTGLLTFYGPNLDTISSKRSFDQFKAGVSGGKKLQSLSSYHPDDPLGRAFYCAVEGHVEGHLVGGNLTALVSLLGTPYEPHFAGGILFLDDISETTGILDRWFTSLYLAGHLQSVRGVMAGPFENCGPRNSYNMLSVMEVFADRLRYLGTPSCFGLPFGASKSAAIIPIGIEAKLDCTEGVLEFAEAALS